MTSIVKSDLEIRSRLISGELQSSTEVVELVKYAALNDIALFILRVFGRCYFDEVIGKLKSPNLQQKIKEDRVTIKSVYKYLQANTFDKFVQALAKSQSGFSAVTVTEIGNKYFLLTKFLPWPVQQLKAIPKIEGQWKGIDVSKFIGNLRIEEESIEKKLLVLLEQKRIDVVDVFAIETLLLSPFTITKQVVMENNQSVCVEKITTLFSLLQSWMMVHELNFDKDILARFPLLKVLNTSMYERISYLTYKRNSFSPAVTGKIILSTPPIAIPGSQLDKKEMAANSKQNSIPSSLDITESPSDSILSPIRPVSFTNYCISYLIQCICINLDIINFTSGTQYTHNFYKQIVELFASSLEARKDAVYFSANLENIPPNSPARSFLLACQCFMEFRKKVNPSKNISFVFEWLYFADIKDRDFSTYPVEALKGNEEMLHDRINQLQISDENKFFVLMSLLSNLKLYSSFNTFLESVQRERFFFLNSEFIVEFFREKIKTENFAALTLGFESIKKIISPHIKGIYQNQSLWITICKFIDDFGVQKLVDVVNEFTSDVMLLKPIPASSAQIESQEKNAKESAVKRQAEEIDSTVETYLEEIFTAYLKLPAFRLGIKKINEFLGELSKIGMPFSPKDRYNFLHKIRLLDICNNAGINKNISHLGMGGAVTAQLLQKHDDVLSPLILLCGAFNLTGVGIIDVYLDYISLQDNHYLNKQYSNLVQIRQFINIPLGPLDVFQWLKYCPDSDLIENLIKSFQHYRQRVIEQIRLKKIQYSSIEAEHLQKMKASELAFASALSKNKTVNEALKPILRKFCSMIASSIVSTDASLIVDCFKPDFLDPSSIQDKSFRLIHPNCLHGKAIYRRWHIPKSDMQFPVLEISLINLYSFEVCTLKEPFPLLVPKFKQLMAEKKLQQLASRQIEEQFKLNGCNESMKRIYKFFDIGMLSLSLSENEQKVRTELLTETGLVLNIKKLNKQSDFKECVSQIMDLIRANNSPIEKKFLLPIAFNCKIKTIAVKENEKSVFRELSLEANAKEYTVSYTVEEVKSPSFDNILLWHLLTFKDYCESSNL